MNEHELAALYAQHGYGLYRRCLAYLGDPARAQDALQEVFVRALGSAQRFRGEASARTWLSRIADHLCIDLLRRDRRSPFSITRADALDADSKHATDSRAVELFVDDAEALLTARRLMCALDPQAQRLAVLCFVDELTQEEIAAELALSRRTVGKRIKALRAHALRVLGEVPTALAVPASDEAAMGEESSATRNHRLEVEG